MSEITLTLIQMGFLALLWIFAFAIASAIRADLFGVRPRQSAEQVRPADSARPAAPQAPAAKPAKPVKLHRGAPTKVVVIEGADSGKQVPLSGTVTMGRGPTNDVDLSDEYVSIRHARFIPHNGQWYVEDLGSTNGTWIDRTRITGPTVLRVGAKVRVGRTTLQLQR